MNLISFAEYFFFSSIDSFRLVMFGCVRCTLINMSSELVIYLVRFVVVAVVAFV